MKISIIGYSGSGKSTLAAALGRAYSVPVLHLDRVQFAPGWVERPREDKLAEVQAFLDTHESWVIDGNYTNLWYARRLEESDKIIFMDFGRWTCLYRVLLRFARYHGQTRDSMGEGCPEKIDAEFLRWVLFGGRTAEKVNEYETLCRERSGKVIRIRNQRQLDAFYREQGLPRT